jgi:hypothetical protein
MLDTDRGHVAYVLLAVGGMLGGAGKERRQEQRLDAIMEDGRIAYAVLEYGGWLGAR